MHLDAAVGALDHVVVGEDVAGLVENESRALALLRHGSVEEVEDQRGGGDVDHRGQNFFVDGDVVLLFGVVGGRGMRLSELSGELEPLPPISWKWPSDGTKPGPMWVVTYQNPPTSTTIKRKRRKFMRFESRNPSCFEIRRLRRKVPPGETSRTISAPGECATACLYCKDRNGGNLLRSAWQAGTLVPASLRG